MSIDSIGFDFPIATVEDTAELDALAETVLTFRDHLDARYVFTKIVANKEDDEAAIWRRIAANGRYVAARLERLGITWSLEPECYAKSIEMIQRSLDAVDHPNLPVNLDHCNFHMGGSDPVRAAEVFAEKITKGHIKDYALSDDGKQQKAEVGRGLADHHAVFAKLVELNLPAVMHLEHCNSTQEVERAVKFMQGVTASCRALTPSST